METHTLFGVQTHYTAIDPAEVVTLSARYGNPVYRRYDITADEHLARQRWRPVSDRRGEVVFAIRQPSGEILLHTKAQYNNLIYRLPTGGINPNEAVEDALFREIEEETGQAVAVRRFLGIFDCRFHLNGDTTSFTSYIFYLESLSKELNGSDTQEISGYQLIAPEQLGYVALALRGLRGKRRRWGYWRSLAHDLVYRYLTCPEAVIGD
ncbi:MAG: NUDIX hydrolase [Caldilineaceae bacterium]|nr:NUDIX hydrolase [Caldilineaceae bacterium]